MGFHNVTEILLYFGQLGAEVQVCFGLCFIFANALGSS